MNRVTHSPHRALVLPRLLVGAFFYLLPCLIFPPSILAGEKTNDSATPNQILQGLRQFYQKTARPDGSFAPGIDPDYLGQSDCAYSDLAAITYACTIHRTFGWKLPHEKQTVAFLLSRQQKSGAFVNLAGTVNARSAEGKTYNTTQALVALHALGARPRQDPIPVFEEILKKQDLRRLPPYMSSFFPLAYRCYRKNVPTELDQAIRETMFQDETGYLNNHIAATFHASHYNQLLGTPTPKAFEMVTRILRDQRPDGSWLRNMPSRDRHATFDAVFTLLHEGRGRADVKKAIAKAAQWALSCRNPDGGFGHFPGSPSDADAVYFQVGTLVMAGYLKPADPLPKDPELHSWGHLMPVVNKHWHNQLAAFHLPDWVGATALDRDGQLLAAGCADGKAYLWDLKNPKQRRALAGHTDVVVAVEFAPDARHLATGSYDRTAKIWDVATGQERHTLKGHRGAVLSVAWSPDGRRLATGSIDSTIKLWDSRDGKLLATLAGHRSWVNSVAFGPGGKELISGSSDGTVKVWDVAARKATFTWQSAGAEVRSVAISADGKWVAAGLRYGGIRMWETSSWRIHAKFEGFPGFDGDIWCVRFSPDGKIVIWGGGDWNRPGWLFPVDVAKVDLVMGPLRMTGEVLAIALSRNCTLAVAGGDNMVRVYDLRVLQGATGKTK